MAKRTSPVEEEDQGGEFGKFGRESGVAHRDFAKPTSPADVLSGPSNKIQDVDDELKSTRAEVDEAREENERLKKVLTGIAKDYEALQMHLFDIVDVQQQPPAAKTPPERRRRANVDVEEPELVSLRLGTTTIKTHSNDNEKRINKDEDVDDIDGLTLGLDVRKFDSSSNSATTIKPPPSLSSEEGKEEDRAGEPWPPSKNSRSADEQVLKPQAHRVKRARVSVRARCDTPTMNDGGQWRKYGQKVSKGNPCPRAYYRCTGAPTCPVRKQVQRCAGDMSILTTTYEGTHNHPLPVSATAMASATSTAASMLTSGSSASRASSSTSAYPHGLNYNSSGQFYLQNQLICPSSNSHPTITLDLTTNNKYDSSNFSSSIGSNSTPSTWTHSSLSQAYWQMALPPPAPNSLPTGTIARAIASDSSFQSALAAAIASYVGAAGARAEIANAVEREFLGFQ